MRLAIQSTESLVGQLSPIPKGTTVSTITKPDARFADLAAEAFSDYLVQCNVTDSLDHWHAETMSPVHPLFELSRSLENHKAEAANAVGQAAFGWAYRPVSIDA